MLNITRSTCRVCLNIEDSQSEIWKSITDIDDYNNNLAIYDKMKLISGLSPDISTDFAKLICPTCFKNLEIAYDFQNICRKNEILIINCFAKYTKNILQNINEPICENTEPFDRSNEEINKQLPKFESENKCFQEICNENRNDVNNTHSNFNLNDDNSLSSCDSLFDIQLLTDVKPSNFKKLKDNTTSPVSKKNIKCSSEPKYSKLNAEEKIFVCELCGNIYKKKALLTDHMKWHSGSKDFKCEICGKAFLLNTYLARHIRTHTGIRNFKCNFCSRTFYTNGLKRAHEKVHTGERCYKCELCHRSFSYSQSLQRHMLVHSGIKPHKCEHCEKEFRQESHLKQHMATNIHQPKQRLHRNSLSACELQNSEL